MKSHRLIAAFVISACLIPLNASAACIVCWGGYTGCRTFAENSCNELPAGSSGICFTLGAEMFRPGNDYILYEKGRAWLVQGSNKTEFASDSMSSTFKRLSARYPAAKNGDSVNKERDAVWSAFFSRPDSGAVSPAVLAKFGKEMKLGVRRAETGARKVQEQKRDVDIRRTK